MFGTHYNRRVRESFIEILAQEGWKYFSVKNLNELFVIMLQKHGTKDEHCDQEVIVEKNESFVVSQPEKVIAPAIETDLDEDEDDLKSQTNQPAENIQKQSMAQVEPLPDNIEAIVLE